MTQPTGLPSTLPATTVLRVLPDVTIGEVPGGDTAHLLDWDDRRTRCGRRPARLARVASSPRRVCISCARKLPDLVRMHLATLAKPTAAELAAVHEHAIRTEAQACHDRLTWIREQAVLDGSIGELVQLTIAVPADREPGARRQGFVTGQVAEAVRITIGALANTLMPGMVAGGQVWISGAPAAGSGVLAGGGSPSAALAIAPRLRR